LPKVVNVDLNSLVVLVLPHSHHQDEADSGELLQCQRSHAVSLHDPGLYS
jgi:hypothetical protein